MPRYRADFIEGTLTVNNTVGSHGASSGTQARRHKVLEFSIGCEEPADQAARIIAQRYSAAGTSTAVTPSLLDLADAAFLGVAGENHTVEPTYTAGPPPLIVFSEVVHFRNPIRYYAPPGAEIVIPATNAAGIGWYPTVISSGTPDVSAAVILEE